MTACLGAVCTLWLGLALIASLLVGVASRFHRAHGNHASERRRSSSSAPRLARPCSASMSRWVKFLAGIGAIVLTFLAGAELDPIVFKKKWKEATAARPRRLLLSIPRLRRGGALRTWVGT